MCNSKNHSKRMLTVLLLASLLTSCAGQTTTETTEDTLSTEQTEQVETEASALWKTELPATDMKGWECKAMEIGGSTMRVFQAEEITGEVINDALYTRNQVIADTFNVHFSEESTDNWWESTDLLKQYVLAGSDDYQLHMVIQRDAFAVSLENMIASVDMLPYVEPENPWYIQSVNDAMTLGDRQYILYSAECLNLYGQTCMVMFNERIWNTISEENPYTLVREGKWTYDKFAAYTESAVIDLNGDGKVSDNDQLGVVGESDYIYPSLWVGAGFQMVEMVDDTPTFTVGSNEALIGFLQDVLRLHNTNGVMFDPFHDVGVAFDTYGLVEEARDTGRMIFESGAALLYITCTQRLQAIREMEEDFGVLPLPKYNEEQEQYYSRIIDGWLNVVPSTNQNLEYTSIVLEAIAEESYRSVLPAFMEVSLKSKYIRDEESAEMLDLIFRTTTLDLGDTVWQGSVRVPYVDIFVSGKDTFASKAASIEKSVAKVISDAMEILNSNS